MARKSRLVKDWKEIRITGPHCSYDGHRLLPGETATVPAELAQEWISTGRALTVSAEVKKDDTRTDSE